MDLEKGGKESEGKGGCLSWGKQKQTRLARWETNARLSNFFLLTPDSEISFHDFRSLEKKRYQEKANGGRADRLEMESNRAFSTSFSLPSSQPQLPSKNELSPPYIRLVPFEAHSVSSLRYVSGGRITKRDRHERRKDDDERASVPFHPLPPQLHDPGTDPSSCSSHYLFEP